MLTLMKEKLGISIGSCQALGGIRNGDWVGKGDHLSGGGEAGGGPCCSIQMPKLMDSPQAVLHCSGV